MYSKGTYSVNQITDFHHSILSLNYDFYSVMYLDHIIPYACVCVRFRQQQSSLFSTVRSTGEPTRCWPGSTPPPTRSKTRRPASAAVALFIWSVKNDMLTNPTESSNFAFLKLFKNQREFGHLQDIQSVTEQYNSTVCNNY